MPRRVSPASASARLHPRAAIALLRRTGRSPGQRSSAPCSASSAAPRTSSSRWRSTPKACRRDRSGSPSAARRRSGSRLDRAVGRLEPSPSSRSVASASSWRFWPRLAASGAAADRLAFVLFLVVSTSCRATVNALNYAVGVRAARADGPMVVRCHQPRLGGDGPRLAAPRRARAGERQRPLRVRRHHRDRAVRGTRGARALARSPRSARSQ